MCSGLSYSEYMTEPSAKGEANVCDTHTHTQTEYGNRMRNERTLSIFSSSQCLNGTQFVSALANILCVCLTFDVCKIWGPDNGNETHRTEPNEQL